jgi:hypothetical protein
MELLALPLQEQVREVKREFRLMMNGITSQSMREKGLTYRTNFGVELPRLKVFSEELPHTTELAAALWKEQVRECRLLAPMLMPAKDFEADLADLWVEQMNFPEEAECVVMHLFQHLPYASQKAFEWIAREEVMPQLCGWHLFGRLFGKGATLSPRDAEEWRDQMTAALASEHFSVKQAAYRALLKYMDLGDEEERFGETLLNP